MKLFKQKDRGMEGPRVEMAPLIDVVFLLLIFFAVSTTFVSYQKGIELTLPSASTTNEIEEVPVIAIDAKNRIFWDGVRITESAIRHKVSETMKTNEDLAIQVYADRKTPYSQVIRILDEIRQGGCFKVSLAADTPEA